MAVKDDERLVGLQGQLCVSAYRYLRSLDRDVSVENNLNDKLMEFNKAYNNYKEYIGEIGCVLVHGMAGQFAESIIKEAKDYGLKISRLWERRISDNVEIKYGTFKIMGKTPIGDPDIIYTVDAIFDIGNERYEYPILTFESVHKGYKVYDMRGKLLADGELTYYDEPLTVVVQGRTFDIDIDQVRTADPFDKDNVHINKGTGDLYIDDDTNRFAGLYFYDPEVAFNYVTQLPDFQKEIKEKAYIKILEFMSLFGNMTEEEFIDKIDIRDSNGYVPIEQYHKFKGHQFKLDTQVCPEDVVNQAWSNGPRYIMNTFYDVFVDILNYITFVITDPSKRMNAYLQYGEHRRKNEYYSTYSFRNEYDYDLGNKRSGFKYTIPLFRPVHTFTEKVAYKWMTKEEIAEVNCMSGEMLLDIDALYLMLIIYRMCKFYSKDAIDWWKHGMTDIKGCKEYTLQSQMHEITRIIVYVNNMETDDEALDRVLYNHMFL